MCLPIHAITSAAIATVIHALIPSWTITHHVLAVVIAVCSHGLLDRIPHLDWKVDYARLKVLVYNLMLVRRRKRLKLWGFTPVYRFGCRDPEARWALSLLGLEVLGIFGLGLGLPYFISRTPFALTLLCVAVGVAPDFLEWFSAGVSHRWAGPVMRWLQAIHDRCHIDPNSAPIPRWANLIIQSMTGVAGIGALYLLG